jgi:hypothetical protein
MEETDMTKGDCAMPKGERVRVKLFQSAVYSHYKHIDIVCKDTTLKQNGQL